MTSGLPNLFNQYSVDENRVTNALLQTLNASHNLTTSFLEQFVNVSNLDFDQRFAIWSQKQPKADEDQEGTNADERATIPDGWIVSEQGNLTVVIESKIQAGSVSLKQLRGHIRRGARNRDFYILLITPDKERPAMLVGTVAKKHRLAFLERSTSVGNTSRNSPETYASLRGLSAELKGVPRNV